MGFLLLSSSLPGHHGAASRKRGIHQENRQTLGAWHTRTSQTQKHRKRNACRQQGLPPRMLLHFSLLSVLSVVYCVHFCSCMLILTCVYIQSRTASHTRSHAHTCPCVDAENHQFPARVYAFSVFGQAAGFGALTDEEVKRAQVRACTWGGWRCRCLARRSLTEASMRLKLGGVKQAVIAMRQQKEEEERRKLAEQQR